MPLNRWTPLVLLWACSASSCARRPLRLTTPCSTAGPRLAEAWSALDEARKAAGGCDEDNGMRCEALRAQIERLSIDCASNPDIVMSNALLAYDQRNFVRAQQLLDELSTLQVSYPEAAVLRARIALDQGNMPFALRFLDQQIRQTGDHAGLREVYASALYLTGRWDEAKEQLAIAQRLGAPAWRVAYGQGLIEEAAGKRDEAQKRYQEALLAKPGWKLAASRLRALEATEKK
jgi:tetratricopeptide (TPR) repeat protein